MYDLFLYIVRTATYEIPYVGGRARGRQRPRAPTLAERPDGHRRTISLGSSIIVGGENGEQEGLRDLRERLRNMQEKDEGSS